MYELNVVREETQSLSVLFLYYGSFLVKVGICVKIDCGLITLSVILRAVVEVI